MIKDLPVSYHAKNMHIGREVEHDNKTFHVDENIVDLMLHLWDHNFITYASCSGGKPDNETFTRYEEVRDNFWYQDRGYIMFRDTIDYRVFTALQELLFNNKIIDNNGFPLYSINLEKQINNKFKKQGYPVTTTLRWDDDSFHYVKSILMGELSLIDMGME